MTTEVEAQHSLKDVRRVALSLVARREYSRSQLRQKLLAKDFEPELVEQVIAEVVAKNFQNDARFGEAYLQSRIARGYGPIRIKMELIQQKGLSEADADAVLATTEADWSAVLQQLFYKKFRHHDLSDPAVKAKCFRFLYSHGFSTHMIEILLDEL